MVSASKYAQPKEYSLHFDGESQRGRVGYFTCGPEVPRVEILKLAEGIKRLNPHYLAIRVRFGVNLYDFDAVKLLQNNAGIIVDSTTGLKYQRTGQIGLLMRKMNTFKAESAKCIWEIYGQRCQREFRHEKPFSVKNLVIDDHKDLLYGENFDVYDIVNDQDGKKYSKAVGKKGEKAKLNAGQKFFKTAMEDMQKMESFLDEMKKGHDDIPGVTTPFFYLGAKFTTSSVHLEDMFLPSVNYLFNGSSPKYWLFIDAADMVTLNEILQTTVNWYNCPMGILHKGCYVTTQLLDKHKIPYDVVMQEANEMIITFSRRAHVVINGGKNLAIAMNWGYSEMLYEARSIKQCKCPWDKGFKWLWDYMFGTESQMQMKYKLGKAPAAIRNAIAESRRNMSSYRRNDRAGEYVQVVPVVVTGNLVVNDDDVRMVPLDVPDNVAANETVTYEYDNDTGTESSPRLEIIPEAVQQPPHLFVPKSPQPQELELLSTEDKEEQQPEQQPIIAEEPQFEDDREESNREPVPEERQPDSTIVNPEESEFDERPKSSTPDEIDTTPVKTHPSRSSTVVPKASSDDIKTDTTQSSSRQPSPPISLISGLSSPGPRKRSRKASTEPLMSDEDDSTPSSKQPSRPPTVVSEYSLESPSKQNPSVPRKKVRTASTSGTRSVSTVSDQSSSIPSQSTAAITYSCYTRTANGGERFVGYYDQTAVRIDTPVIGAPIVRKFIPEREVIKAEKTEKDRKNKEAAARRTRQRQPKATTVKNNKNLHGPTSNRNHSIATMKKNLDKLKTNISTYERNRIEAAVVRARQTILRNDVKHCLQSAVDECFDKRALEFHRARGYDTPEKILQHYVSNDKEGYDRKKLWKFFMSYIEKAKLKDYEFIQQLNNFIRENWTYILEMDPRERVPVDDPLFFNAE